jgi:hypothetical protein
MRYPTTDSRQDGAGVGLALSEKRPIESSFQPFLIARDVLDREPIANAVGRELPGSWRASQRSPAE